MDHLDYKTDNKKESIREEELPKIIHEDVSDISEDSHSPEEFTKPHVIYLLGQDDSTKEEISSTVINDAVTLIKKEDISIMDVALTDKRPVLEMRNNDNYCENIDIIMNNMDKNDIIIYDLITTINSVVVII